MTPRQTQGNNSRITTYILSVSCIILLITSLVLGSQLFILTRFIPASDNGIKQLIASQYWASIPTDNEYREAQLSGLVAALKDPYSEYVTKSDREKLTDSLNRRYEGVGIQFDFSGTSIKVVKTIPGSPAEAADVKKDDILSKVDSVDVKTLKNDEILSRIRGVEGSSVELEFLREGQSIIKNIKRAKILTELITLEVKGDTGVITINSFGENLDSKMQTITNSIRANSSINNLIIDVRDDGGGLLNESVEVISYFLPAKTLILQEKSKSETTELFSKSKSPSLANYPLQVLINGNTASASEILAGSLRDQRGVKLIGQKSFGKGVVQKLFPLNNGDSLKLTVAEWLTPKGNQINSIGLEPDIIVEANKDALDVALANRPNL